MSKIVWEVETYPDDLSTLSDMDLLQIEKRLCDIDDIMRDTMNSMIDEIRCELMDRVNKKKHPPVVTPIDQ